MFSANPQGVFIERDQEAVFGHYARWGIAIHRMHKGIAIKASMLAKGLVRHVEAQVKANHSPY